MTPTQLKDSQPKTPRVPLRRLIRLLLVVIALDLALVVAGAAVGGYELLAIQRQAKASGLGHLTTQGAGIRDRLNLAGAAFGVARVSWWPWRPLAGAVAAIGGPARVAGAIGPLLDLGADGSTAGAHALDGLLPALTALRHGSHASSQAGERLMAGLQGGRGALLAASGGMSSAQADWRNLDASALPASIRQRLLPLDRYLSAAGDALTFALAAPDLLGATHPRDYLLVPENPWDLRATGGFAGTVALLEANHGKLTLTNPQPSDQIGNHRPGYVQPPLPLLLYEHLGNWFYRDANWFPDFPTSAALLRYFYAQGQGRTSDGVIAFESNILGPLLQLTGPVGVPGIPVPLTAANGVQTLDHYVNSTGTVRKSFASAAYGEVFRQLLHLPSSQLTAAVQALGTALKQKHLLVWLPDHTLAPILARHGWNGAINPTRSDYLFVVDTNVHYNKINRLIDESIAYHAVVEPDRSLHSTLTISYHNTAYYKNPDQTNLPKPQNNTLYEDFVRAYVPLGSRLLGVSGLTQPWPTTRDHNKTVFSGYLRLPSQARAAVTFSYVVPPNALLDTTTYHLTIQKQAGTTALPVSATLVAGVPGIRVNGGASWTWQGRLDGDLPLTTALTGGVARPEPLVYDASSAVTVAPGAVIAPGVELSPG